MGVMIRDTSVRKRSSNKPRIEELFDIIVEFPESEPALNDLRLCVDTTGQQMNLIQSLRNL